MRARDDSTGHPVSEPPGAMLPLAALGGAGLVAGLALAWQAARPLLEAGLGQPDRYAAWQLSAGVEPTASGAGWFGPGQRLLLRLGAELPSMGLALWLLVIAAAWWAVRWFMRSESGGPGTLGAGLVALALGTYPDPSGLVASASGVASLAAGLLWLAAWGALLGCRSGYRVAPGAGPGHFRTLSGALAGLAVLCFQPWAWPVLVLGLGALWGGARRTGTLLVAAALAHRIGLAWTSTQPLGVWVCESELTSLSAGARELGALLPLVGLSSAGALLALSDRAARRRWWQAAGLAAVFAGAGALSAGGWRIFELAGGDVNLGGVALFVEGFLVAGLAAGLSACRGRWTLRLALVVAVLGAGFLAYERTPQAHGSAVAARERRGLVEAHRARLRERLVAVEPSDEPVFYALFPDPSTDGRPAPSALTSRPASTRPVWPLQPLSRCEEDRRPYLLRPKADLVWPFGESARNVPSIPTERSVDESELIVRGTFPHARIELVLYTEHGYGSHQLGAFADWPATASAGSTLPERRLPLAALATALRDWLEVLESWGARRGYVEVRAVDDAHGKRNRPVAASRFLEVDLVALAALAVSNRPGD